MKMRGFAPLKAGYFRFLGLAAGLLLLMGLSSCDAPAGRSTMNFGDDCWATGDTVDLEFDNSDTTSVYTLHFPVTLTEDYAYNNIYLRATIETPSGATQVIPQRYRLSEKTGEWMSEPSGDEIPFQLYISDELILNQIGTYRFRLYHFMRDERLCGVRKVGVVIDVRK